MAAYKKFEDLTFDDVQKHPFHLVTPSPWPIYASLGALLMTLGGVMYMHRYTLGGTTLLFGMLFTSAIAALWWRDVIREAVFKGPYTDIVKTGLKIGFVLFILSEVMFFFGFFWAYFHSACHLQWK